MQEITPKQAMVLAFLQKFIDDHGYPPSMKEIADGLDFRSANASCEHLKRLKAKGFITMQPGQCRSIQIVAQACAQDVGGSPDHQVDSPGLIAYRAIRETDPASFYKAFIAPLATASAQLLASKFPLCVQAQFIYQHAEFVERHLVSFIRKVEGGVVADAKARALLNSLASHYQHGYPITLAAHDPATAPQAFKSPEELIAYFESVVELFKGEAAGYMAIWQANSNTMATGLAQMLR
jgi:SOS-response transcriptional repressor LexA